MTTGLLWTALDASIRISLVAALVGVLLLALRIRASGIRNAVWTTVLVAMLAMPVLPSVIPALPIPMPIPAMAPQVGQIRGPLEITFRAMPSANATANGAPAPGSRQMPARPPAIVFERAAPPVWPVVLLVMYLAGAGLLLTRLIVGWRASVRVVRGSRRVEREGLLGAIGVDLLESTRIATPLTVGILRPRVILPDGWRAWPAPKLEAVVAHERAHVRRRDALVGLVAHLNRCIFWFHPLAWWLERTLATTAEHACDDEGVRAIGGSKAYAAVLIDIADAVRRRGSRLSWQDVGMDGNGQLAGRIDRVLDGGADSRISRVRKTVIGIGSAAAILLVVACRQQAPVVPVLAPDPDVAASIATNEARTAFWAAARAMAPQDVSRLEAVLASNPEDVEARKRLLIFYFWTGANTISWNDDVAARRRHALWLIAHHPDSDLMEWADLTADADPAGYAQARSLWIDAVAGANVGSKALGHAATFFQVSEKPRAEALLERARASDPSGPLPRVKDNVYYAGWTERLGVLYAQVIVGAVGSTLGNVVHETSEAEAHSAYSNAIRRKLAATKDPAILGAAGSYLLQNAREATTHVDRHALAVEYLERAGRLDPSNVRTRALLYRAKSGERHDWLRAQLQGASSREAGDAIVLKFPDAERLEFLPERLMEAESWAYQTGKNTRGAPAEWDRLTRLAREALAVAARHAGDPASGPALYWGHLALGMAAYVDGDRASALAHLRDAGAAPASDALAYSSGGGARLPLFLLEAGEREPVAVFYEELAAKDFPERERLLRDAASVRAGRMPTGYQYQIAARARSSVAAR